MGGRVTVLDIPAGFCAFGKLIHDETTEPLTKADYRLFICYVRCKGTVTVMFHRSLRSDKW